MDRRGLLLAAACAASATPVSAQQQISVALGRAEPGQLPEGFRMARTGQGAPAAWSVVDDASVPAGRVLAQTSADQTDYRFPLAIYDLVTAKDVEVAVRFKAVAGRVDRAGGIAVRLTDADNYYVLRANALEDNVNFYHVVRGSRRQIRGVDAKVEFGSMAHAEFQSDRRPVHHRLQRQDAVQRGRPDVRERRQGRIVDQGRQRYAIR